MGVSVSGLNSPDIETFLGFSIWTIKSGYPGSPDIELQCTYFENATAYSKRTLKTTVATQLNYINIIRNTNRGFVPERSAIRPSLRLAPKGTFDDLLCPR